VYCQEAIVLNQILLYLGAFFAFVWGVAHLFPTKSVVAGFGEISQDNKRIIMMEWIIEGVSLIFIGLLVAVVTRIDVGRFSLRVVCWICFAELNVLSIVSLFTGFKVAFLPFKLCPFIFTGSSILILLGGLL
jgi:chromate transport protein ChrA